MSGIVNQVGSKSGIISSYHADTWRLTVGFDDSGTDYFTSNIRQCSDTNFSLHSSGVIQTSTDSGIFEFPSTGLWSITFQVSAQVTSSSIVQDYVQNQIEVSTGGGGFVARSIAKTHISNEGTYDAGSNTMGMLLRVVVPSGWTNPCQVKFKYSTPSTVTWEGSSTINYTAFIFHKIAN